MLLLGSNWCPRCMRLKSISLIRAIKPMSIARTFMAILKPSVAP